MKFLFHLAELLCSIYVCDIFSSPEPIVFFLNVCYSKTSFTSTSYHSQMSKPKDIFSAIYLKPFSRRGKQRNCLFYWKYYAIFASSHNRAKGLCFRMIGSFARFSREHLHIKTKTRSIFATFYLSACALITRYAYPPARKVSPNTASMQLWPSFRLRMEALCPSIM